MTYIITRHGDLFERIAWAGGTAPKAGISNNSIFGEAYRDLRKAFFREYVKECGGLDLWSCAGTSALQKARTLRKHASYDAWATLRNYIRNNMAEIHTSHSEWYSVYRLWFGQILVQGFRSREKAERVRKALDRFAKMVIK